MDRKSKKDSVGLWSDLTRSREQNIFEINGAELIFQIKTKKHTVEKTVISSELPKRKKLILQLIILLYIFGTNFWTSQTYKKNKMPLTLFFFKKKK